MFQKQPMMRKVIYALVPIYLFAFYLYGFRLIFLTLLVFPVGIATEYIMEKRNKKKVSEAVWVTCLLYVLSLPPLTPWWIAIAGIVFGILFCKEVFGGFGRNPFNPAICSRLFVYIAFSINLTQDWTGIGFFGFNPDAVAAATPLEVLEKGGSIDILSHFFGLRMGSMGESSILLIILAAVYLIWTKTASWQIIVSTLGSAALLTFIFDFFQIKGALPNSALMSGSLFFVAVFMATDPVTAPKNAKSKWIYGILIGSVTVLIRTFSSVFIEGTSFAVLIGNAFAMLLDEIFSQKKGKK